MYSTFFDKHRINPCSQFNDDNNKIEDDDDAMNLLINTIYESHLVQHNNHSYNSSIKPFPLQELLMLHITVTTHDQSDHFHFKY
jgi:hypothetical protein